MNFADRRDAGEQLASALQRFNGMDTVVMALPRGGVVVGVEVAKSLHAPLGLILVRKIGHPTYMEFAIGAITESGELIYNQDEVAAIDNSWLKKAEAEARELLKYRRELYFGDGMTQPEVEGKTVIIVDDGIATGLTMEAAVRAIVGSEPKRIIVAVPVASSESVSSLEQIVDEVIVLDDPNNFLSSVGGHYNMFNPVEDEEVRGLLLEANYKLREQGGGK